MNHENPVKVCNRCGAALWEGDGFCRMCANPVPYNLTQNSARQQSPGDMPPYGDMPQNTPIQNPRANQTPYGNQSPYAHQGTQINQQPAGVNPYSAIKMQGANSYAPVQQSFGDMSPYGNMPQSPPTQNPRAGQNPYVNQPAYTHQSTQINQQPAGVNPSAAIKTQGVNPYAPVQQPNAAQASPYVGNNNAYVKPVFQENAPSQPKPEMPAFNAQAAKESLAGMQSAMKQSAVPVVEKLKEHFSYVVAQPITWNLVVSAICQFMIIVFWTRDLFELKALYSQYGFSIHSILCEADFGWLSSLSITLDVLSIISLLIPLFRKKVNTTYCLALPRFMAAWPILCVIYIVASIAFEAYDNDLFMLFFKELELADFRPLFDGIVMILIMLFYPVMIAVTRSSADAHMKKLEKAEKEAKQCAQAKTGESQTEQGDAAVEASNRAEKSLGDAAVQSELRNI